MLHTVPLSQAGWDQPIRPGPFRLKSCGTVRSNIHNGVDAPFKPVWHYSGQAAAFLLFLTIGFRYIKILLSPSREVFGYQQGV
jgi:hypothetical protein